MRKNNFFLRIVMFSFLLITHLIFKAIAGDDAKSGIQFRTLTFEKALAASKAENKSLYIHCYADWCTYCKYMVDSVYTDKEVSDFYNANFVSVKINMEKEGKELCKVIKGHTWPTMLYYENNGELMHRAAGRKYKQPFLELGLEALDTNRQMRTFKRKYESATASPGEVQFYFRMQEKAGMDAQLMINDYLSKQSDSDFTNANNWRIMYDIIKDPNMPVLKRIIENKKKLEAIYTADSINNKLINLNNTYLMTFIQQLDSVGYENAKRKIKENKNLDIANKICAFADLNKYKMKSDWETYKIEGKKFVEKYAMDDFRRLLDVAGIYYERFAGDKNLMALAEEWVQRSISIGDYYKGNNLLASISFVLGKKEQALNAANHAIELGKRYNNDYNQATQLLKVIEKMP